MTNSLDICKNCRRNSLVKRNFEGEMRVAPACTYAEILKKIMLQVNDTDKLNLRCGFKEEN